MRWSSGILIVLLAGCAKPRDPAGTAVDRAVAYLVAKQGADGGWHSETYGLLRSGQSLTAFVLAALRGAPGVPRESVERAERFLRERVDRDGALGRAEKSIEDYPNYATALAIVALGARDVDAMVACLKRQQFAEAWGREHPAYGAWGMGGPRREPPHAGHVDLSMTRHVLEAVAAAGGDREAFARAEVFLSRLQNPDGGFLFSTVVTDANKGGPGASYGTATADGILALLAMGVSKDDPRVVRAAAWLEKNHRVDRVPGLPDSWATGMHYYYLAACARAFAGLGRPRAGIEAALVARQRADGSWMNGNLLMKEDDPLIATTLALSALLACR